MGAPASRLSVCDFLRRVYVPARLTLRDKTVDQYDRACRSLERFHGRAILVLELSETLVLGWLQQRLREVSQRTVKRERDDLLTIWRYAVRKGFCANHPLDIPTIHVPRKLPVAWSVTEFERLLAVTQRLQGAIRGTGIAKADWWFSLMLFLYDSGARIGAALALKPSQLNLEQGYALLAAETAKTDTEQAVRLSEQTVAAIRRHYNLERRHVWPWPYNRATKWHTLTRLLCRAGLPSDRYHKFHCLRKTCYTFTCKHASREAAGRQLGHRTDLSAVYADPRHLAVPQAADVLPRPKLGDSDTQLRLF